MLCLLAIALQFPVQGNPSAEQNSTLANNVRIEQDARLEVIAPSNSVVPGQSFPIGVRIHLEQELLEQHLLQLFHSQVDLPVQVQAAWLEAHPGLRFLEPLAGVSDGSALPASVPAGLDPRASLVLNERIVEALRGPRQREAERTVLSFVLTRRVVAIAPGTISLPAASMRLAYASGYQEGLLGERIPIDRHDQLLGTPATEIEVLPFPEENRPLEFVDAVGDLQVSASLSQSALTLGQDVQLTLRIEGQGNFHSMSAPRVDGLSGWHTQGTGLRRDADALVLMATLSPKNSLVGEVPGIDFAWFEPTSEGASTGSYRVRRTEPIPVRISAQTDATKAAAGIGNAPKNTPQGSNSGEEQSRSKALFRLRMGIAVVGLLIAVVYLARSKSKVKPPQQGAKIDGKARLARARALSQESANASPHTPERSLWIFLTLACGQEGADLKRDHLTQQLQESGVPASLAKRVERSLTAWEAARFGGIPTGAEIDGLETLIDELSQSLR